MAYVYLVLTVTSSGTLLANKFKIMTFFSHRFKDNVAMSDYFHNPLTSGLNLDGQADMYR